MYLPSYDSLRENGKYGATILNRKREKKSTSPAGKKTVIPKRKRVGEFAGLSTPEIRRLINDLETYRTELEMQNEDLRAARKDLESSQIKYSSLFNFAPVAYFTFDKNGVVTEVNFAGAELLGYERRYLPGKPFSVFITDTRGKAGFRNHIASVLSGTTKQTYEIRLKKKDGSSLYARLHSMYFDEGDGDSAYIRTAVTDISERRKWEEALVESEKRYRDLVEFSPNGIGVESDGVFVFLNSFGAKLLGAERPEELMGKSFIQFVHPDYRNFVKQRISDLERKQVGPVELKFLRLDGTPVDVEASDIVVSYRDKPSIQIMFRDITPRVRALEALRESERQYREMLGSVRLLALILDRDGRISFCNDFLLAITGWQRDEILGRNWFDTFIPGEIRETLRKLFIENFDDQGSFPSYYVNEILTKGGERRLIAWNNTTLRDFRGQAISTASIGEDITERKRAEETIKYQATHDLLTGLPNRSLLMEHLEHEITQCRRTGKMVAVMFLDLDRFKNINDTLGHAMGDELLREVAFRLREFMRNSDVVGRIGGDEFTMLITDLNSPAEASKAAQKILSAFNEPFLMNGNELHLAASIGISVYPSDSEFAETLMKNADIAMFQAKEQGRNNFQFYNLEMNIRTIERMILENSLRQMLRRGELVVHYQPQIDIRSGSMVCAEALVRWQHPELGLLNPMQFIPLAEETGLIVPIDEWVLRTACAQNRAWQREGLPSFCVTVNLSSRQFQQPNLVETVASVLNETGLDPKWLQLEITERTAMQDTVLTVPNMTSLTKMGINFSIDDFGTGYSSLSYLKRLPIQKLKIDKSFISGIPEDSDYKAIVNAVIVLAHTLKLKVIAEGVETDEQLKFLKESDCDEIQGYIYRKPLRPEEFIELFKDNPALPGTGK